jgi:hypothetical protein
VGIPCCMPIKFHQPIVVRITHKRVHTLRERNHSAQTIICHERRVYSWRFFGLNGAFQTVFGRYSFKLPAHGTRVVLILSKAYSTFVRLSLRLDVLFNQAHIPTPVGCAGWAALFSF